MPPKGSKSATEMPAATEAKKGLVTGPAGLVPVGELEPSSLFELQNNTYRLAFVDPDGNASVILLEKVKTKVQSNPARFVDNWRGVARVEIPGDTMVKAVN